MTDKEIEKTENNNAEEELGYDIEKEAVDASEITEILEKYDSGANFRKSLPSYWRWFLFGVACTLSLFQLYTAYFGTLPSNQQRGFHVALALGMIYLLYPANKTEKPKLDIFGLVIAGSFIFIVGYFYFINEISWTTTVIAIVIILLFQLSKLFKKDYYGIPIPDVILSLLGFSAGLYHFFFYIGIINRVGIYNEIDFAISAIGVLLVLGAAKRVIGTPIVVVASSLLIYAYMGPYFPDFLQHRGFSVYRIISHSFLSTEGILGIPIAISSTFIFLFLMFGVILTKTGLEEYFTDLAMSMTGWMTGGTAKVGVLTSVFSGMITGSSVANTVGNGAFTIPMMKRSGYKPEFAAAVEAASSTGGQITPPVMGSAAFLMIEFTGIPYVEIVKAAIVPALLFFTAQFIIVHYQSKKWGILGVPRSKLKKLSTLIFKQGYLLLPIVAIIYMLSIGRSPMRAALSGIAMSIGVNLLVMIVAFILGKYDKVKYKLTPKVVFEILEESARSALPVISACACAGIIVGVITLTGLGLRVAGGIISLAGGVLILTMFFTMISSIILGMGLPTTANYVITATMAAPALLELGVPVIAAHLFVFYFGIVADITPPVALASYAGAGIAKSNPFETSLWSVKIAVGAFLVPYMFVLSPQLLLVDVTYLGFGAALFTAILGMFCIGTSVVGYIEQQLNIPVRIILAIAGISLLYAQWITDVVGLAIFLTVFIHQKVIIRRIKRAEAEEEARAGITSN